MQIVLRFFHAQQRMFYRVIQQYQISEHFNRTIGYETRDKRILERIILAYKNNTTILRLFRNDILDTWNTFSEFLQNGIEYVPVIFPDIAGDLCQIISARRKMFAEADIFYITGFLYLKIRHIPIVQQSAKRADCFEFLKLAQSLYRQDVGRVVCMLVPTVL